ncbi:outer membrane beta-barrel protein [Crocinitomix catalasitica]|nr:outer membrane beta-barrel protein [Crocinitomix catalasitica]
MKKLLFLLIVFGLSFGTYAQDKKFQVGLCFGPTINLTKIQTQKIQRAGAGGGFTIGLGANALFSQNIGLAFGIQFDLETFKINYGDLTSGFLGDVYYAFKDTDIKKFDEDDQNFDKGAFTDTTAFLLMTRKFRAKYITIPFFLKFQTNLIGKMIYYGKFGLRTSILAGVRMDDEGFTAAVDYTVDDKLNDFTTLGGTTITMPNMKPEAVKKGLALARTGIGIYGGAEWNFTGNTFLYAEFGFNYGITPALYQKSSHLVDKITDPSTGAVTYEQIDVKNNPQHIFELKIGILF